ncbi:MAG: FxDxF family PEP-CTERM protein [Thiobacillus sp.]|nr:FxDxF family PEP-CTERM protein [Thiobacillus sp.]
MITKSALVALCLGLGLGVNGTAVATVPAPTSFSSTSLSVGGLPYNFSTSKSFSAGTSFQDTWGFNFASAANVFGLIADMEIPGVYDISDFEINLDGLGWVSLSPDFLSGTSVVDAGLHTLAVKGTATGSMGGGYTFSFSAVPVPEAETWAMLLAGLGLVVLGVRRQMKKAERLVG